MTIRRTLRALAVIIAVLLPARLSAQVRGQVIDAASGDAIAGAVVWLRGATTHVTSSAADGTYVFADAGPGSYCIRVDSPGYARADVCIAVTASARMIVDLPLAVKPLTIAPLVVTSRRGATQRVDGSVRDSLRAAIAGGDLALPGTRAATLAAAQLGDLTHMPSSDPTGGGRPHTLYVWGSSADRGRVLLDGASLNAPLHLGALLPPLDPAIVATANMRSGGISPRYDGGTSYVMDFTTRAASRSAATWGELDLLAGRIGAEALLGEGVGVIMSARRVNDEVIDGILSSDFGYGYADGIARADIALGADAAIHVTGLMTRESVSIPRDLASDQASWSNRAATAEWRREDADDMRSVGISISRGSADLPLLSAIGGHLEASLDRFSGTAERRWRRGDIVWNAGAELEHLTFRRRSRATVDPITGEAGDIACTVALPCSHARATLAAIFAEALITPAPRLQLSVGSRAMYDVDAGHVHMLPRAALTVLPSDLYSVTISAGRFSQPYVTETPLSAGDAAVDLPVDVDVARALHLELDVARHTGGSHIRAGVFVRRHGRVDPTARTRIVPGADVSLEQSMPVGTLSLAYSISGGNEFAYDETRGRRMQQLITAGWNGSLGRWSADLSAAYGSGLPLTSIVLEQPMDAEIVLQPTQPSFPGREMHSPSSGRSYLRVDAAIGAEWRLGANGATRLMPYVRIINALGERESLFYFQDGDAARPPRGLAALPAVPMIGVRWQF